MAYTVRNLITEALVAADAVSLGETPDNSEIVNGLSHLNDIVNILSLENLWAPTLTKVSGQVTSGKTIYTIGDVGGEDISTPRPPEIVTLTIKNANTWYPIKQVSEVDFENTTRLEPGINQYIPYVFTYRPKMPSGEIEVYPTPGSTFDIEITTRDMITSYGLNDSLPNLAPGYTAYLKFALAALVADDNSAPDQKIARLQERAGSRLATLKRQNNTGRTLSLDPILYYKGKNYDIRGDRFLYGGQ